MTHRPLALLHLVCFALLFVAVAPSTVGAQPAVTSQADATYKVHMEVGETRLVRLSSKIVRVSIAEPTVADVRVVTPLQVLVTAKSVGFTHLILWGDDDKPLVIAIVCSQNLNDLRTQLRELFPDERINVGSVGELVVLSGKVADLRVPARIAEVAKLHSKQLANLVEVSGDQQVQLEVRFAEVSRSGLRKMGMSFLWADGARGHVGGYQAAGSQAGTFIGGVPVAGTGAAPLIAAPVAGDAFSLIFSTGLSSFPFSTILSILAQEGLAKVLAEPTVVALSGHEASFHAGGEIPILIAQQLGSVSVQFKKFGVLLKFTPTVLGGKTISLKLSSEVSEPDSSLGVSLGGYTVPGFKTRNSETTVRLKDGQSFAIAGLLSDTIRSTVKKIPLLGEIPVLGALFRSTSFQREESELLVVVKAHLTQPLQMQDVPPMPGEDEVNDPSDFQLFMLGSIGHWKRDDKEKKKKDKDSEGTGKGEEQPPRSSGGPMGPIGFMRD